jgi:hypothetical protein
MIARVTKDGDHHLQAKIEPTRNQFNLIESLRKMQGVVQINSMMKLQNEVRSTRTEEHWSLLIGEDIHLRGRAFLLAS